MAARFFKDTIHDYIGDDYIEEIQLNDFRSKNYYEDDNSNTGSNWKFD